LVGNRNFVFVRKKVKRVKEELSEREEEIDAAGNYYHCLRKCCIKLGG